MNPLRKLTRAFLILKSQIIWRWRFGALGNRTIIGRCRRVVNAQCVFVGDRVGLCAGWHLQVYNPDQGQRKKIVIGDDCVILYDFQCNSATSVEIQDHVLIASRVFITDTDHVVDPIGDRTTRSENLISAPVVIEHDCWIGQNAVVLKGVRIHHHSIVGANAVVTRNVPACSVVAGAPAKVIRTLQPTEIQRAGRWPVSANISAMDDAKDRAC